MFVSHERNGKYSTHPPIEFVGLGVGHASEMLLMQLTPYEYFAYLATFPSFELVVYDSFLSYTLDEKDSSRLVDRLNGLYRKLK